jgi:NtrC-family two-component system sensor histidine kinase KinB
LLQRSRSLSEQHQELVTAIDEDVGRLKDLANELLDLARGTAAAITLKTVPVDIGCLLEAVTRTFALQAEQKRVMLTAEFDDSAPKIRVDPIKLSWVVSNLVANALRYTPADGIIALSAEMTPPIVQLRVRDTGTGIAPQVQERLFERFAQWNVNGAGPGSAGLGLAIAKEIVQAHGGRIFVDSTLGKGTCFTVELPTGDDVLWQSS